MISFRSSATFTRVSSDLMSLHFHLVPIPLRSLRLRRSIFSNFVIFVLSFNFITSLPILFLLYFSYPTSPRLVSSSFYVMYFFSFHVCVLDYIPFSFHVIMFSSGFIPVTSDPFFFPKPPCGPYDLVRQKVPVTSDPSLLISSFSCHFFLRLPIDQYGPVSKMSNSRNHYLKLYRSV